MKATRKKPGRGRGGAARRVAGKKVLVIDVGGTSVKILATGEQEHRAFPSGPKMTPKQMVVGVKKLAATPRACPTAPTGPRAWPSLGDWERRLFCALARVFFTIVSPMTLSCNRIG